jgi:KDO2-lipid IV(A) lauroyltransferase
LPFGQGFTVHVMHPPTALPKDTTAAAQTLNDWVEHVIQQAPEQYMWGYDRFKQPRG